MSSYRLLIIDDSQRITDALCELGNNLGFSSKALCHSKNISSLYPFFLPDVIVLDIIMPEMDGFEVLSYLHQQNCKSHIILMSGDTSCNEAVFTIGRKLGLSIFTTIVKPMFFPDFLQTLMHTLNQIKKSLSECQKGVGESLEDTH